MKPLQQAFSGGGFCFRLLRRGNDPVKITLLRAALVFLLVPAAAFWCFAAWRSRLETMLANERAAHDRL
jgi:hypothetical protein